MSNYERLDEEENVSPDKLSRNFEKADSLQYLGFTENSDSPPPDAPEGALYYRLPKQNGAVVRFEDGKEEVYSSSSMQLNSDNFDVSATFWTFNSTSSYGRSQRIKIPPFESASPLYLVALKIRVQATAATSAPDNSMIYPDYWGRAIVPVGGIPEGLRPDEPYLGLTSATGGRCTLGFVGTAGDVRITHFAGNQIAVGNLIELGGVYLAKK